MGTSLDVSFDIHSRSQASLASNTSAAESPLMRRSGPEILDGLDELA
jgi:hypothetical protein